MQQLIVQLDHFKIIDDAAANIRSSERALSEATTDFNNTFGKGAPKYVQDVLRKRLSADELVQREARLADYANKYAETVYTIIQLVKHYFDEWLDSIEWVVAESNHQPHLRLIHHPIFENRLKSRILASERGNSQLRMAIKAFDALEKTNSASAKLRDGVSNAREAFRDMIKLNSKVRERCGKILSVIGSEELYQATSEIKSDDNYDGLVEQLSHKFANIVRLQNEIAMLPPKGAYSELQKMKKTLQKEVDGIRKNLMASLSTEKHPQQLEIVVEWLAEVQPRIWSSNSESSAETAAQEFFDDALHLWYSKAGRPIRPNSRTH